MKKVRYNKRKGGSKSSSEETVVARFLNSGLGKIILITLSILMLLSVYRSFRQMGQKLSLLKQAEKEVEELRLENLRLSLKIEEAGSIENLEREARDRLNYGQEDEIVFVIDEQLIELGKQEVQAILHPQSAETEVNVLAQWLDFIVRGY
jgi:cell division protein FtsB